MNIEAGDRVELKKAHPCGEKLFLVTRAGMDFKIVCTRCGREVMLPRTKLEKSVKKIVGKEGERNV